MELTQFYTWASLLVTIIFCKISESLAKPTYYDVGSYGSYGSYGSGEQYGGYDRHDRTRSDNSDNDYALTYGKPLTQNRLKTLNTGYYYVDDGYIAPVHTSKVSNQRRQDAVADSDGDGLPDNVRFTPLVRYKQTRTKRKKLFVPNFFG